MSTPGKARLILPISVILAYCGIGLAFLGAGVWLTRDLLASRASIVRERSALAIQTSSFVSQWFGTTIMAADYVLRDITTKVRPSELDAARLDRGLQARLSSLAREKLATLPGVYGLGFLDGRCVFVAAADEHLIGIQSNSRLHVDRAQVLENRTYVEYVPASKSANKQASILVSRPILSSDGHFLGGALAAIMLNSAQSWIESFYIGDHDTMEMIDGSGILLAINPPRPDAIGKPLGHAGQPDFGEGRGSASFIAPSSIDGRQHIYGVSKVEDIPISIVVGYDEARTLREWQQRTWQLAIGYLILLMMLGLLLRMHSRALAQRDEMRKLSITDPLTGVANRRWLTSSGEVEIKKATRHRQPASILMVDIDHFKAVNDTWGHPTGDRVIRSLAKAMVSNLRDTDIVGRLGGEEFAAVLPNTEAEGAFALANRLREFIESAAAIESDDGTPVGFTVSIGVAGREGDESSTFDEVLAKADKALYTAKDRGRNLVVLG